MYVLIQGTSLRTTNWIITVVTVFCVQQVQMNCKDISKSVVCESKNNKYTPCEIKEASRIISVSVMNQIEWFTYCHNTNGGFYNRANYGSIGNILWVRDGCRAVFSICYRPMISTTPMIQSTSSRDLTLSSQMTSKHSEKIQTYKTVSFSLKSDQVSSTPQTLSSQKAFKISSTTIYTHLTSTKKATLKEHTNLSSLLMQFSTSNDESLTVVDSTTLKASMIHKADTTDVPLVAIVVPIVIIVIGALAATIFLSKKRCYRDSKSKAISAKMDCNVLFDDKTGAGLHANGSNVMKNHRSDLQSGYVYATVNRAHKQQPLRPAASKRTNSDSELCYINTMIVDPDGGKLNIKW